MHSDVWGPCSIPSIGRNKWFILFVDDYSPFTWLCLTKSKPDIPALIIQFCKMIQTQFELNIKRFRTDNGSEFMKSTIETYFKTEGILHESADTVPIRVYERKRRKGNKVVHADDETGSISCPGTADLDK